mmetsp:Transcript_28328/g.62480  ORF Transcript_28328/g.62480 Transcript_28328/m.62480 type:complete len:259 (-) Transcript_28328:325-1101(-)
MLLHSRPSRGCSTHLEEQPSLNRTSHTDGTKPSITPSPIPAEISHCRGNSRVVTAVVVVEHRVVHGSDVHRVVDRRRRTGWHGQTLAATLRRMQLIQRPRHCQSYLRLTLRLEIHRRCKILEAQILLRLLRNRLHLPVRHPCRNPVESEEYALSCGILNAATPVAQPPWDGGRNRVPSHCPKKARHVGKISGSVPRHVRLRKRKRGQTGVLPVLEVGLQKLHGAQLRVQSTYTIKLVEIHERAHKELLALSMHHDLQS